MCCYRRLLCIRWQDFQTNESIRRQRSRQHTFVDRVRRHKLELFGHICRMPDNRMLKRVLFGAVEGPKVATTRDDHGRAGSTTYWSGATWHYNRVTSCTGSCDVEESHSWPLRFLNHGTRRRRRRRRRRLMRLLTPTRAIWCNGNTPKLGWNTGGIRST